MPIVQTRYRDIPWEETGCPSTLRTEARERWNHYRGKPICIEVPSSGNLPYASDKCAASECVEPKYRVLQVNGLPVLSPTGRGVAVCSHIAEIGD
jgi:hypothetical protein